MLGCVDVCWLMVAGVLGARSCVLHCWSQRMRVGVPVSAAALAERPVPKDDIPST